VYASSGILIFGHDEILLETRRLVLECAGFRVWTATKAAGAMQILVEEPIGLFVLCNSLSSEEHFTVLKTARTLRRDMKTLVLSLDCDDSIDNRDTVLTSFLDPKSFIALIHREIDANGAALLT
jgi:DNA-binding response OmpR family regulator